MRNLNRRFDRYYIGQIYNGDFAKLCCLLRIYELYKLSLQIVNVVLDGKELSLYVFDLWYNFDVSCITCDCFMVAHYG